MGGLLLLLISKQAEDFDRYNGEIKICGDTEIKISGSPIKALG
jgi:hypothetical protein